MMRTNFLFLGTFLSLFLLYGCPVFVDTTPPVKQRVAEPFGDVPDTLYYYDPDYLSNLDYARPYQIPASLKVKGFEDQLVIAPEFAGASALDQVVWRVIYYGWYCVTDSTCQCIRQSMMYPGDIFHLGNSDSLLVGQDKVYPGDNPWSVSTRIMRTDSLQYWWQEQNALQK